MTAPLANVLRHIRMLVGQSHTVGGTDGELLDRFVSGRDEAAFEELMARHGPMVLGVCQQLLRDPHDAEDAFQATFLVLVRRAGSIGKRNRLAGWLYGVAHRVALRASAQTTRRRGRERQGVEMVAVEPFCGVAWDDLRPVIHEEVNRLPDKYRTPVVLCYLEGKTQEEAAKDLGWTQGMVKGRLERARDLLRKRLARRGLALSVGALAAVVSPTATAVPPAVMAATVKAATLLVAGRGLAAGVVSAHVISLMEGVLKTMFLTKLKIAAVALGVMAVVGGVIGAGVVMSTHDSAAAEQERIGKDDQKRGSQKEDKPPVQARPEIEQKAGAPKVQVMKPISRKIVERQEFTGRTEADTVEVLAQASGMLDKVHFEAGAAVKKGELLFQIDPRPYQAEMDKAEAEFVRAEARVKNVRKLLGISAKKQEDFFRISGDLEDAQATLQSARANRDLAKLHLESTKITAPISGRIGRPLVPAGSVVKEGTTRLATIVATEPMYVGFDIDERTFVRLRRVAREGKIKLLGATVLLGWGDEKGFPDRGTIDFVGNQVRADIGTLSVRAVVRNPDHLLVPGLFVRVRLEVSEPQQALLVPEEVVQRTGGRAFVFLVTDQKKVERRAVKLGFSDDGMRVVNEGLAAEDSVILGNWRKLREGTAVQPERVSAPSQPKD